MFCRLFLCLSAFSSPLWAGFPCPLVFFMTPTDLAVFAWGLVSAWAVIVGLNK